MYVDVGPSRKDTFSQNKNQNFETMEVLVFTHSLC